VAAKTMGRAVLLGGIWAAGRMEIGKKWGLMHPHEAPPPSKREANSLAPHCWWDNGWGRP